jgi:SAM-dependent methyltransferase
VGCGNGALLRAFSSLIPGWSLAGTELSDKYRTVVESIEGVESLYTCSPEEVPGSFDLIVVMHALEHIPFPKEVLVKLRGKLAPEGRLVVEVPDHLRNPFDLMIADHSTHFTAGTLGALIRSAGFELNAVATDWMPKELTALARRGAPGSQGDALPSAEPGRSAWLTLSWLKAVIAEARRIAALGEFGLFGTSIAATWLDAELANAPAFFVDEDPSRVRKSHLGRPIRHPRDMPPGSHVFLALPVPLAAVVKARLELAPSHATYHAPPPFPHLPRPLPIRGD